MTRTILTKRDAAFLTPADLSGVSPTDQSVAGAPNADNWSGRVIKYLPAESVVVYTTIANMVPSNKDPQVNGEVILWVTFAMILFFTPLYLRYIAGVKKQSQALVSTLAFVVWVFSLGGPFEYQCWYAAFYGAVALPLFTLVSAFVNPHDLSAQQLSTMRGA